MRTAANNAHIDFVPFQADGQAMADYIKRYGLEADWQGWLTKAGERVAYKIPAKDGRDFQVVWVDPAKREMVLNPTTRAAKVEAAGTKGSASFTLTCYGVGDDSQNTMAGAYLSQDGFREFVIDYLKNLVSNAKFWKYDEDNTDPAGADGHMRIESVVMDYDNLTIEADFSATIQGTATYEYATNSEFGNDEVRSAVWYALVHAIEDKVPGGDITMDKNPVNAKRVEKTAEGWLAQARKMTQGTATDSRKQISIFSGMSRRDTRRVVAAAAGGLDDLAKEAQKYATAEEFANAMFFGEDRNLSGAEKSILVYGRNVLPEMESVKHLEYVPVQGKPVKIIPGINTFISHYDGAYRVSEKETGLLLAMGKTAKEAQAAATEIMRKHAAELPALIESKQKQTSGRAKNEKPEGYFLLIPVPRNEWYADLNKEFESKGLPKVYGDRLEMLTGQPSPDVFALDKDLSRYLSAHPEVLDQFYNKVKQKGGQMPQKTDNAVNTHMDTVASRVTATLQITKPGEGYSQEAIQSAIAGLKWEDYPADGKLPYTEGYAINAVRKEFNLPLPSKWALNGTIQPMNDKEGQHALYGINIPYKNADLILYIADTGTETFVVAKDERWKGKDNEPATTAGKVEFLEVGDTVRFSYPGHSFEGKVGEIVDSDFKRTGVGIETVYQVKGEGIDPEDADSWATADELERVMAQRATAAAGDYEFYYIHANMEHDKESGLLYAQRVKDYGYTIWSHSDEFGNWPGPQVDGFKTYEDAERAAKKKAPKAISYEEEMKRDKARRGALQDDPPERMPYGTTDLDEVFGDQDPSKVMAMTATATITEKNKLSKSSDDGKGFAKIINDTDKWVIVVDGAFGLFDTKEEAEKVWSLPEMQGDSPQGSMDELSGTAFGSAEMLPPHYTPKYLPQFEKDFTQERRISEYQPIDIKQYIIRHSKRSHDRFIDEYSKQPTLEERLRLKKNPDPWSTENLFSHLWNKDKKEAMSITATIRKEDDGYHVRSKDGKNLGGPYKTEEEAKDRLKQVETFKHKKAAAEKEPWEMTQNEWREQWLAASKAENKALKSMPSSPLQKSHQWGTTERIRLEYGAEAKPLHRRGFPVITHESVVRKALSEGKPVPPEVLADYPDLAKPAATAKAKPDDGPTDETYAVYGDSEFYRTGDKFYFSNEGRLVELTDDQADQLRAFLAKNTNIFKTEKEKVDALRKILIEDLGLIKRKMIELEMIAVKAKLQESHGDRVADLTRKVLSLARAVKSAYVGPTAVAIHPIADQIGVKARQVYNETHTDNWVTAAIDPMSRDPHSIRAKIDEIERDVRDLKLPLGLANVMANRLKDGLRELKKAIDNL